MAKSYKSYMQQVQVQTEYMQFHMQQYHLGSSVRRQNQVVQHMPAAVPAGPSTSPATRIAVAAAHSAQSAAHILVEAGPPAPPAAQVVVAAATSAAPGPSKPAAPTHGALCICNTCCLERRFPGSMAAARLRRPTTRAAASGPATATRSHIGTALNDHNYEAVKLGKEDVYKEKCRQEMEMLRKKQEELLQVAIKENEDKLTQVRRRSKRAEELLVGMQVNGERLRQEVDELRRRQEESVQVALRKAEERKLRVVRKNEERLEGLRRKNLDEKEEVKKEREAMEQRQRRENQERGEELKKENKGKEEELEEANKVKVEQLEKEYFEKVELLRKENKETKDVLQKRNEQAKKALQTENKVMEERLELENEESLAVLTKRNKEKDEQILKEIAEGNAQLMMENMEIEERQKRENEDKLAILISENKARMTELLAKQEEEERVTRKRKADQLEPDAKRNPSAPECPVCPELLCNTMLSCIFGASDPNPNPNQVCFEEMVPPTRIFQCGDGGHLVCETCKLGLNQQLCPICREKISGRATGMENFLKDLLSTGKTLHG